MKIEFETLAGDLLAVPPYMTSTLRQVSYNIFPPLLSILLFIFLKVFRFWCHAKSLFCFFVSDNFHPLQHCSYGHEYLSLRMCPTNFLFLLISVDSSGVSLTKLRIFVFDNFSVNYTPSIFLQIHISNVSSLAASAFLVLHVSDLYITTLTSKVFTSRFFSSCFSSFLETFHIMLNNVLDIPIRERTFFSKYPYAENRLSKYLNFFTFKYRFI